MQCCCWHLPPACVCKQEGSRQLAIPGVPQPYACALPLQVIMHDVYVASPQGDNTWKGMVFKGFKLWNWEVSKAFGAGRMVPAAPEGHLAPRMLGLLPGLALKTTTELEFRNKTLQVRPGLSLA